MGARQIYNEQERKRGRGKGDLNLTCTGSFIQGNQSFGSLKGGGFKKNYLKKYSLVKETAFHLLPLGKLWSRYVLQYVRLIH